MRNPIAYNLANNCPIQLKDNYPQLYNLLYNFYLWLDSDDNFLAVLTTFQDLTEFNNEDDFYSNLILQDLGWNNSYNIAVSKKFLISTLRDFFLARGTFWSFQYLFRILFAEKVELNYPREKLFKLSSSTYSQDRWILTKATSYGTEPYKNIVNPLDIHSRIITGLRSKTTVNAAKIIPTILNGTRYLMILISDTKLDFISNEYVTITYDTWKITEKILNTSTFNIISPGYGYQIDDEISISTPNAFSVTGKAKVKDINTGTITDIIISNAGSNYSIGDIIRSGYDKTGTGFIATVSEIDEETGAINGIKIWSSGYNYSKIPILIIESDLGTEAELIAVSNSIGGIKSIIITEPFWGTLITQKTINITSSTGTGAILSLNEKSCIVSSKFTYKDTIGFLGINCYLPDDWYWQEFSYELKSAVNRAQYDRAIKEYVHPIGTVCYSVFEKETSPELNLQYLVEASLEIPN
jgi:hypothetical protein